MDMLWHKPPALIIAGGGIKVDMDYVRHYEP